MSQVMKSISIAPVLNGFIVSVGCQTLVFNDITTLAKELVEYHTNPALMEKRYAKEAVNPTLSVDRPMEADCAPASAGVRW